MQVRARKTVASIAVFGVAACLVAVARFVVDWTRGELDWWSGFAGRDLYLAAGRGYGKGFAVGFFLAFFLTLLALAVASWWEHRRKRLAAARAAAAVAVKVDG